MMRRVLLSISLLALVGLLPQTAWASTSGAHFMSASASVNNDGALVVNWDEAGLGQQQINYTLSADATAIYACVNGGGNHPKATNKQAVEGQVNNGATFTPENGRVKESLTAGPLSAGSFTCPSGQKLVLAKVTYSNIVLTDTTNNVVANPPDVCRSFLPTLFAC